MLETEALVISESGVQGWGWRFGGWEAPYKTLKNLQWGRDKEAAAPKS